MSSTGRILALAAILASTVVTTVTSAHAASCADTLVSTPSLTRFAAIVQQSGLASQLTNAPLTVFAPTNDAIAKIASITQMLAGQNNSQQPDFPKLQLLTRAHLVSGAHPANEMVGKITLNTLAGTALAIEGTTGRAIVLSTSAPNTVNLSGTRMMENVHVVGATITCDNGVIYPIDNALIQ